MARVFFLFTVRHLRRVCEKENFLEGTIVVQLKTSALAVLVGDRSAQSVDLSIFFFFQSKFLLYMFFDTQVGKHCSAMSPLHTVYFLYFLIQTNNLE